ncbi:hypothetical protein RhiirC2_795470 [Rhizophagus irregularis]|uniref:Uncharacterized protein n=1 Tax=Rhizophagus irregularis TaxID=588596 RepID=A0A2N1MBH8_9GLOM|nr:hypothetical protein RhiirC2_795470 [Rhizophagus irregularis]
MQTEIDLLKQRITELEAELEAKNSEIPELRKKLAEFEARDVEIHELRKKVAEVEAKNAELIKQMMEENNRRDARIEVLEKNKTDTIDRVPTLEQKYSQNNITNNNSSNFALASSANSGERDNFLDEAHKKSVGEDIRRRNKEKKIQRESANQDITPEPAYVAETNNDDNLDEPRDQSIPEKSELFGNFDLPEDDDFTVLSEQAVERDLMQQLSVPSTNYVISKAVTGDHQTPKNNQINASEAQEQSLDSAETLDQYPNLYREFSSEDFDYFEITNEKICPLCKLEHDDEESLEVRPDPELIIKSVLEHFPYLKFREIDNYNFASPQPWGSPRPICDGKHGNYGLHGEWYKNETEYCLTCNTSSNKLKFAIIT